MKVPNYAHQVSVAERSGKRFVRIDRVLADGRLEFFTEVELPVPVGTEDWDTFECVMANVGKSLGVDSPTIRTHFRLESE